MTTMLVEPFPPWLRDSNRFFSSEGGTMPSAFSPPEAQPAVGQGQPTRQDS